MPDDLKVHANSKAVLYRRTSTTDQKLSIDTQDETGRRIATLKGWEVDRVFTEHESGGNPDRPELRKALSSARGSRAVLIVAKLDRLARDSRFLMDLVDGDVPICFGDFPEIDGSAVSRVMVQLLAAFAECERRRMGERMKDWHRARKARGLKAGNPSKLTQEGRLKGAKKANRKRAREARIYHDETLEVIRDLRAKDLSLRAIARHLNEEGKTTRKGKPWTHVTVLRLLKRAK